MCFDHGLGAGCDGIHREEDAPRGPVCLHCYEGIDESEAFDAAGEVFCSQRCALAFAAFGHGENCGLVECSDNAPLALPSMLCAFCDAPTGGPTAHETCRQRVKNALAYQDGARLGAAS